MALQAITKKIIKNKNSCREGGDLMDEPPQFNIYGLREWIGLPDIGVPCIEAKLIRYQGFHFAHVFYRALSQRRCAMGAFQSESAPD